MSRCQGLAVLAVAVIGAWPVAGWSQIEEIVVTTRKKEESLNDVPIAVNAITAEQISRQGVADLNDIVRNTPSVQFDRSFGPSDTRITLRGLSNSRGRSNVAFLVDNIDVTTENLIVAGSGLLANRRLLSDVERIEIVKGPQSALYGRAAFAGAFNYITKDPGDEFEGTSKVDFAQDGFQQVDAAFGGPLSDTIGMRVTGFWYNQDGHYTNSLSGDDVGGSSGTGAAIKGVWKPNDIARIEARGEYSKEDYDPLPNVRIGGGWQDGEGVKLFPYPNATLVNANNQLTQIANPDSRLNGLGFARNLNSTGLLDFGQYCPERLRGSAGGAPGLCLPSTYGSADNRTVTHSENPLTGEDFDGTDLETFRFTTIATFDLPYGLVTSYTGWTNFNARDNYDQDWQADTDYKYTPFGGEPVNTFPDTAPYANGRRADQLIAGQIANTESAVDQFSQEIRFGTKLDGPIQFTVGALFWDETRTLDDRNAILACLPLDKEGIWQSPTQLPTINYRPGLCDGLASLDSPDTDDSADDPTVIGWQERYRNVQPQPAAPWRADTRHWSFYGTFTWEITETISLDLEERFVSERFHLQKPNQSACTNLASALTTGTAFWLEDANYDAICAFEEVITPPDELPPGNEVTASDTVRLLEGSTDSHFDTPKATINWKATEQNLVYFSWAEAQKPGGINQLTGGGSATFLENEFFDPEVLQVWELGSKNTLEVFGALQANIALFFNDYTDKQVNTQVVVDGVSQPRVLNASSAEVWGAEFEFQWQPEFVEGLSFNLAYTYLNAEYGDFEDDVTSMQRLAYLNETVGDCQLIYRDANNDIIGGPVGATSVACRVNLDGNKLERTPEHAVAGGVSYIRPLMDTGLDLLAELNASWLDERFLDQDNGVSFDSYALVDTRIGLIHPKYEIIAYVDNLLDDNTIRSGGSGPDFARQASELGFSAGLGASHFFGTLPDPRIFGIRATYRFGEQ